MFRLSQRQAKLFLEVYAEGDGYKKGKGRVLYTSSEKMANDLHALACLAGFNSSLTTRPLAGKRTWVKDHQAVSSADGYAISLSETGAQACLSRRYLKDVDYNGMVYCATVPAGLLLTRRRGTVIWSGNSAVPDKIKEVAEGGLTDGEPMMFAFGNGTRNTGWFKDCFGRDGHRWGKTHVDSRTVQITNKQFLDEMIEDHGLDSDMVKVRVRGMFPSMSIAQFISTDDVDKAFARHLDLQQYNFAPVILTCDPAWEGDDTLVIAKRQGLHFDILRKIAKNDNDVQIATLLAQLEDEHHADAVNVDAGYGTGIVSAGTTMGRSWNLVWFSGASPDAGCLNLRAYMWREARDWLKEGGAIPPDHDLYRDLISPETAPRMDGKIQLESKQDMKRRGQTSPNCGDALALSFAIPVVKKDRSTIPGRRANREHNPYEHVRGALTQEAGDYDPYR
jgi:hypothetical protein